MTSATSSTRKIHPIGPLDATVRPPGSKSLTNRALLVAALAEGRSTIRGALVSDDTKYMVAALRELGCEIEECADGTEIGVEGCIPAESADLYVGNAGTAMRFLTAALSVGRGTYVIDGDARMRERPIGDLLDGLRQLGADVSARQDRYPSARTVTGG